MFHACVAFEMARRVHGFDNRSVWPKNALLARDVSNILCCKCQLLISAVNLSRKSMLVISSTLQISPYNFTSDTQIWLGPKHITNANNGTTFSPCHNNSDTERQIGPNIEQHCKIHHHLPLQVHLE